MNEQTRDQVRGIIAETFALDPSDVTDETSAVNVAGWTSLGQLRLVAALEQAFGLKFTLDEMAALNSVSGVERICGQHLPG